MGGNITEACARWQTPNAVVDIEALSPHQREPEVRVVGLLAAVEAQVLQELDPGDHLLEPDPHRIHRQVGGRMALGSPQVARHGDPGPVVDEPLEGRDDRPQPEVVGNDHRAVEGPVQGDVEIGPNQHPGAVHAGQVL